MPLIRTGPFEPAFRQYLRLHIATLVFFVAIHVFKSAYLALSVPIAPNMSIFWPGIALVGASLAYALFRREPRLSVALNATALIVFSLAGSVPTTAVVFFSGRHYPLIDVLLVQWDALLGFDWLGHVRWFMDKPRLIDLLRQAYDVIFIEPLVIAPVLALTLQVHRLYAYIIGMTVSLFVCAVIAMRFPAIGPYEFFGAAAHLGDTIDLYTAGKATAAIEWMRAGDFSVRFPGTTVGLIYFPSYHAVTAAIYTWAAWRTPFLRWVILGLNIAMLLATPLHGSHYLFDIVAGLVVAVATIGLVSWSLARVFPQSLPQSV